MDKTLAALCQLTNFWMNSLSQTQWSTRSTTLRSFNEIVIADPFREGVEAFFGAVEDSTTLLPSDRVNVAGVEFGIRMALSS